MLVALKLPKAPPARIFHIPGCTATALTVSLAEATAHHEGGIQRAVGVQTGQRGAGRAAGEGEGTAHHDAPVVLNGD